LNKMTFYQRTLNIAVTLFKDLKKKYICIVCVCIVNTRTWSF